MFSTPAVVRPYSQENSSVARKPGANPSSISRKPFSDRSVNSTTPNTDQKKNFKKPEAVLVEKPKLPENDNEDLINYEFCSYDPMEDYFADINMGKTEQEIRKDVLQVLMRYSGKDAEPVFLDEGFDEDFALIPSPEKCNNSVDYFFECCKDIPLPSVSFDDFN